MEGKQMVEQIARDAKAAQRELALLSENEKNRIIVAMADAIEENADRILAENAKDVENLKNTKMKDRLMLTRERISAIADGVRKVAELPDPVGETMHTLLRPNGLKIGKRRVPMGVVGIIYESRPNVTADAAALTYKTSNAVVLRGGSDAINSNRIIAEIMNSVNPIKGTIGFVDDTSRETVQKMMKLNGIIDVLIPRGGAGLIKSVVENATVPVIETGVGNCHTYIDDSADIDMAVNIAKNAKCSRPSVCNAMETLLVSEKIAEKFLPVFAKAAPQVEIRGCEKTLEILPNAVKASEADYENEFLDLILAVKIVKDIDEAIEHIEKYSTGHSEAIITENYTNAEKFLDRVNSAAVYVNASTRFTDGFEFGFGAEIGISTQKLHARGPMGLESLTTTKYVIHGNGQVR